MLYLKQSTASQSVLIGPFVDATDGATAETALTIANTDIRLSANGGNLAAKNSGGGTHDEAGWYTITLDATDTATVGRLQLHCKMAGALMVHMEFQVLEEAVYDMLYGASALGYIANAPVNVVQLSGDGTAADNAESFFDGTGYAGTGNTIPTVTNVTNLHASAATAAELAKVPKSDGTATWNATALASINSETDTAISDASLATAAALATVDSNVDTLLTRITSTLFSGITSLAEWLGAMAGKQASDATAQTEMRGTGAGSGTYDATTDSQEALRDHVGDGTNLTEAGGDGDHLTAINLPNQTMDITGSLSGSVGSVTGAVGSVTGNVGGNVVGSVASVTGAINTAAGTITTLDALDTAQDTQHGTTQTAIADVPTVAEFEARTLAAASYFDPATDTVANVTEVAQLGTQAKADVNAEADTALSDYDAPTKAELDAGLDALPTAAENATAVLTTQMAESYAANGVAPTLAQAQFAMHQMLMQFGIAGTSITVRKLDDNTTAFVVTLDSGSAPTDAKRV